MARMIPSELLDTKSAAERRLFQRLKQDVSDQVVAFHSVAWLTPGEGGRPREGEADFVVAHPSHGVVVLEVKGGRIRYEAKSRHWSSIGKKGEARIKDPFRQVRESQHLLIEAFQKAKGSRKISVGHA